MQENARKHKKMQDARTCKKMQENTRKYKKMQEHIIKAKKTIKAIKRTVFLYFL